LNELVHKIFTPTATNSTISLREIRGIVIQILNLSAGISAFVRSKQFWWHKQH